MAAVQPHFGHLAAQGILTALELGVHHRLARGPATVRGLARAVGARARPLRMVLDALVGLGELEREGDQYRLPGRVQALLACPGVEAGAFFDATRDHLQRLVADWSQLTEVVRTGRPVSAAGGGTAPPLTALVYRLFPVNYLAATELVRKLPRAFRSRGLRVLDVGAGAAAWSIPFAQAHEATSVVAVDFAPVFEVTRHFARHCGVDAQFVYRAGNLRRMAFGSSAFDVALLGNICHSEGAARSQRLFAKVQRALRPGGLMLVVDMLADDERKGEAGGVHALVFALNMLVHTEQGGTYTRSEYRSWAEAAGFRRCRSIALPGRGPVLAFEK